MANITKKGSTWIIRFSMQTQAKVIYTGLKNETVARRLADKVEELKNTVQVGADLSPELLAWIAKLEKENAGIFEKLVTLGLIKNRKRKVTLADVLRRYESQGAAKNESTQYKYEKTGRYLLQFFSADTPAEEITIEDAERFVAWFKITPLNMRAKTPKVYSEAKINREITAFKSIFKFAEDAGMIHKSPFRLFRSGASVNPDTLEYVPMETVLKVIAECPSSKWRAVIALGRFAGARGASDFCLLTWDKVHWSSAGDEGFVTLEGKTDPGTIPMNRVLEQCLSELYEDAEIGESKVFPDIRPNANVNTMVEKYIRSAGFNLWKKPWYNLRKSFCSDVMESGVDLETYRRITRHSISVAMQHYQIFHKDRQARATATLCQAPFMQLSLPSATRTPESASVHLTDSAAGIADPAIPSHLTSRHSPLNPLSHSPAPPGSTFSKPRNATIPAKTSREPLPGRVQEKVQNGYKKGYMQGMTSSAEETQISPQVSEITAYNELNGKKEKDLQNLASPFDGRYWTLHPLIKHLFLRCLTKTTNLFPSKSPSMLSPC